MSLIKNSPSWAVDEHKMFADSTRRLFDAEMAPKIEKWAEQGIVDRDFWKTVGQQGVMGGSIAEEYGGFGGGIGFDAITVYEQGRTGDTGWGYGIQSIVSIISMHMAVRNRRKSGCRNWSAATALRRLP